ncbi:MAG: mannose-1-phosphate guanyltransferase [Verrucomicrobiales bacterium]|nr:mannose-1-phosphate guanyltransferase [Verrucomicrobiales bacterium]
MSANKDHFAIIMAGGRGERFWPLSREKTPKQLLALFDRKSFLQHTFERVKPVVPAKNIFVITNESQAAAVRKQLPRVPKENIIAEPCGRDTCAAVALGAALVGARSMTGIMAVLPADHVIPQKHEKKFQKILEESFDLASRGQAIATIGIPPSEPATGYGYIRVGEALPPPPGRKPYKTTFHRAERFVEKPRYEKAVEYLSSGQYRWNAGMFVFSFATITESLLKHQKPLHEACERWFNAAISSAKLKKALAEDYPDLRKISFDYGVMENAQNVIVADGNFDWDDLGAWPALSRHLKADPEGNCAEADFVHVDASRNVIFDTREKKNRRPITLVGLRDCVVVMTDDTTLVAHKRATHKMRDLVAKLAESKAHKHLV